MKTPRLSAALAFGLFSLILLGCGQSPPAAESKSPDALVARYVGGEVKRGDIQQAIDNNLAALTQPATAEARQTIVRKIVERRVRTAMIYTEALAKGYAERPEVLFRQAAAEDRVLAEDLLAGVAAAAKVSDAVVVAEVDRRLAQSHSDETRKFSHIYLRAAETDIEARAAAQAKMAQIEQELAAGADFNQLAEKYSTSVMARGGGRIDWTARRQMQGTAADAVFGLAQEGDRSPLIATTDGLHLFRLDGIRLPVPIDAAAIRQKARQELDSEARNSAIRGRRQQELDAGAAEFAPAAALRSLEEMTQGKAASGKVGPAAKLEWVARWQTAGGQKQLMTPDELLALHRRILPSVLPFDAELHQLVENKLLAIARRAQPLTSGLEEQIAEAKRQVLIDSYRGDLIAELDTPPSEEEITRYYRDHLTSSLPLRDFVVDVLYFQQHGERVADIYAAGEEVGSRLRQGASFDNLLEHPPRPDARTCREAHGADPEEIGKYSIRLRKTLANLGDGEVSAAIYLERPVPVTSDCSLEGQGLVFLRLLRIDAKPIEAARSAILKALSKERVDQGVAKIHRRLIAESKLEILLPEG